MGKSSKSTTDLRKSPKQGRSKDLVSAVMDAATRILESVGVDNLTTNKVASKAGVSIGSLYQYFPGKDAIYAALVEREIERNDEAFQKIIVEYRSQGRDAVIREAISFSVDFFYEKRVFFSAMMPEMMRLKRTRQVLYRRNLTIENLAKYIREVPENLRDPEQVERQMYIASHAIAGVLQTAALEDFEHSPPEMLKPELERLLKSYLYKE